MDFQRKKKNRWPRFILLLLFIGWLIIGALKLITGGKNTVISPIPDDQTFVQPTKAPAKSFTFFKKQKSADDLAEKIEQTVNGAWNDYSIVVEQYGGDFSLRQSEAEIFVAASVNKVPIIAALYYLAGKDEIDLDRDITVQASDIQDYGTGSIRYDKPGSVYSIKTLAKLMIKQSDNTAAYILANHIIGFPRLSEIVTQWGLTQTDMVKNNTSNQDIAKLFRMIYEGKITDSAHTQEMLSFFKDTDHETRLPAKLPDKALTYHKIGTEVGIIHDAGIVTDGKITYYIGLFISGAAENEETDALMADVSKLVYDYLQ
ncbi:MAG: serine hydrolase [Patescibacteria group bacterium]